MGMIAIGFTGLVVIGCAIWYYMYGFSRVQRVGAIYHVHARLGANQHEGLEHELMGIVRDRTQDENLSYEQLISRMKLNDFTEGNFDFDDLLEYAVCPKRKTFETRARSDERGWHGFSLFGRRF
jgi:hypothetical protein